MAKGLLPRVDFLVLRWRLAVIGVVGCVGLAGAGCGELGPAPAAHFIAGGGVSSGNDSGVLSVYVTDEDLGAPVQGASVEVAPSQAATSLDAKTCHALTDSTGLATFDGASCPSITGRVTLTASVAGYAPSTWVGVRGANLTIPIRAASRPEPPTATVSGTIDLWEALPLASANHQLLGIVVASRPARLGDAPDIRQGTRTIDVLGGSTTVVVPANVCVRTAVVDDCHWQLQTRAGTQAHFAVIVDQDTNGTADPLDDINTVVAWAVKTSIAPQAGTVSTGEVLKLMGDDQMTDLSAVFPPLPPDMANLTAFPIFDLGPAGRNRDLRSRPRFPPPHDACSEAGRNLGGDDIRSLRPGG